MEVGLNNWLELRMHFAEIFIGWGVMLLPKDHPDSRIWAKHIEQASVEVKTSIRRSMTNG
jgi:hypothetical protein